MFDLISYHIFYTSLMTLHVLHVAIAQANIVMLMLKPVRVGIYYMEYKNEYLLLQVTIASYLKWFYIEITICKWQDPQI